MTGVHTFCTDKSYNSMRKILALAKDRGTISMQDIVRNCIMSRRVAQRLVAHMLERDVLVAMDGGNPVVAMPRTFYKVGSTPLASLRQVKEKPAVIKQDLSGLPMAFFKAAG